MRLTIALCVALLGGASLVACGDDPTPATTEPVAPATTEPVAPATTEPVAPTTAPTGTDAEPPAGDETAGLWPPGGADTPEDAAAAFVRDMFEVDPVLGEFQAGDSRSGEIEVLGPEDTGVRATLFVRQLGASDAWYVIGAASAGVEIDAPTTYSTVPAGPLTVEGTGRGFEGTIVVRAVRTDASAAVLDEQIAAGGAMGDLEPFSVTLDLATAEPGDSLMLIVRGDTGLDGDTGEFTAIAVIVG
jgi:hypothetical protein